jgi:hypothetical protein
MGPNLPKDKQIVSSKKDFLGHAQLDSALWGSHDEGDSLSLNSVSRAIVLIFAPSATFMEGNIFIRQEDCLGYMLV